MMAAVLCALVILFGCAKKKPNPIPVVDPVPVVQDYAIEKPDQDEPILFFEEKEDPPFFVLFGLNSAETIEPTIVAAWADYLRLTTRTATLIGHACPIGEDAYNYDLGMFRALAIKSMIVGYGVDPNRITVDSRGEKEPLTMDPSQFERNRRVEIIYSKGEK